MSKATNIVLTVQEPTPDGWREIVLEKGGVVLATEVVGPDDIAEPDRWSEFWDRVCRVLDLNR